MDDTSLVMKLERMSEDDMRVFLGEMLAEIQKLHDQARRTVELEDRKARLRTLGIKLETYHGVRRYLEELGRL